MSKNRIDMTQHTYDNESVQELLGWAKKCLRLKIIRLKNISLTSVLLLLMVNSIWNL